MIKINNNIIFKNIDKMLKLVHLLLRKILKKYQILINYSFVLPRNCLLLFIIISLNIIPSSITITVIRSIDIKMIQIV